VLGLICDEDSEIYEDKYGLIKKFKMINGIDSGFQSQVVRLFLPKLLDGKCLISDIDMLPLSVKYFEENSIKLTDKNIIVYSSDNPECLSNNMYPMCYIAAHSKTYIKVFDLNLSWENFCALLKNRNEDWYTDQKFLFEKINKFFDETKDVIFLKRGWNKFADKRIDRISWSYDSTKVKDGYYIDSHLLRPYNQFRNEIDKLIDIIN
jgi:hypothetical protein